MDRESFEIKVKRINPNFKVTRHWEPCDFKEDWVMSGSIMVHKPKPSRERLVFNVLDKDGFGKEYTAYTVQDREPTEKDVEKVKIGDQIRKQGRQMEEVKRSFDKNEAIKQRNKESRKNEITEMTKDFRPIVRDLANELGVSKAKPTVLDEKWDNKVYMNG